VPIIDRALAFRLAGAASCDWRTAERFLRGETIRGLPGSRLRAAASALGITLQVSAMAISSASPVFAEPAAGKAGT